MTFIHYDEVVMPMSKRHSHHRCKQRMEKLSGPRLFEREWIYILPTSDQHRNSLQNPLSKKHAFFRLRPLSFSKT
jgi:hypothetical protein